uniref:Uncharacterized protein n=1 Tax=Plectus sambesii TaxID=2011161 RepID=A0A914W2B5_9BILA
MSRRESWARVLHHINGLLADKIKRIFHNKFYHKFRTVSIAWLLAHLKEDMEQDGGFKCLESHLHLIFWGLGFQFQKLNTQPIIFERQDLIKWQYMWQINNY